MKPLMTREGKGDVRFSADLANAPATCMGECICARDTNIYLTESRGCRKQMKGAHYRKKCVPLMGCNSALRWSPHPHRWRSPDSSTVRQPESLRKASAMPGHALGVAVPQLLQLVIAHTVWTAEFCSRYMNLSHLIHSASDTQMSTAAHQLVIAHTVWTANFCTTAPRLDHEVCQDLQSSDPYSSPVSGSQRQRHYRTAGQHIVHQAACVPAGEASTDLIAEK